MSKRKLLAMFILIVVMFGLMANPRQASAWWCSGTEVVENEDGTYSIFNSGGAPWWRIVTEPEGILVYGPQREQNFLHKVFAPGSYGVEVGNRDASEWANTGCYFEIQENPPTSTPAQTATPEDTPTSESTPTNTPTNTPTSTATPSTWQLNISNVSCADPATGTIEVHFVLLHLGENDVVRDYVDYMMRVPHDIVLRRNAPLVARTGGTAHYVDILSGSPDGTYDILGANAWVNGQMVLLNNPKPFEITGCEPATATMTPSVTATMTPTITSTPVNTLTPTNTPTSTGTPTGTPEVPKAVGSASATCFGRGVMALNGRTEVTFTVNDVYGTYQESVEIPGGDEPISAWQSYDTRQPYGPTVITWEGRFLPHNGSLPISAISGSYTDVCGDYTTATPTTPTPTATATRIPTEGYIRGLLYCIYPDGRIVPGEGETLTVQLSNGNHFGGAPYGADANGLMGVWGPLPEGGVTVSNVTSSLGEGEKYRGGDNFPQDWTQLWPLFEGENNVFSGKVGKPAVVHIAPCGEPQVTPTPKHGGEEGGVSSGGLPPGWIAAPFFVLIGIATILVANRKEKTSA